MFVDGYDRCNHKESLPPPFEERPRQYEPFLCSIIGKTSELDTKDETRSGKTKWNTVFETVTELDYDDALSGELILEAGKTMKLKMEEYELSNLSLIYY